VGGGGLTSACLWVAEGAVNSLDWEGSKDVVVAIGMSSSVAAVAAEGAGVFMAFSVMAALNFGGARGMLADAGDGARAAVCSTG